MARPLLLLLAAVVVGCRPLVQQVSEEESTAASTLDAAPANDRAYQPVAEALIAEAEDRIRVVMYLVQDTPPVSGLLDDLIDAAGRGVEVQVLFDEEGGGTPEIVDRLVAGGVDAKIDSPDRKTHNKLMVADQTVLLGSHNWTGAALQHNTESAISVRHPALASFFGAYADALWEDSDADPVVPPIQIEGLVPRINEEVVDGLEACIDGAEDRLDLAMYALAWSPGFADGPVQDLLDALEGAQARGVPVRVLLDRSAWIENNQISHAAASRLLDAGIDVRQTHPSRVTHAKLLQCDDTVIISDANWSYSGLTLYHASSLALTDPALASEYLAWFEDLFDDAVPWME